MPASVARQGTDDSRNPERTAFVEAAGPRDAVRKIANAVAALEGCSPDGVREDVTLRLFETGWSHGESIPIDETTAATRWRAERMDYELGVWVPCAQAGRAQQLNDDSGSGLDDPESGLGASESDSSHAEISYLDVPRKRSSTGWAPSRICGDIEFGGEGEIRTHGARKGTPVFKTGALNRSATSPCANFTI